MENQGTQERQEQQEQPIHPETHSISIWFFIGGLLVVYGAVILGAGIYGLIVPPAHPVVLNELHFSLWWGAILFVFGLIYAIKFFPKKKGKG